MTSGWGRRSGFVVLAMLLATLPADIAIAFSKSTAHSPRAVQVAPPPTSAAATPTAAPTGPPDFVAGRAIPSAGIETVADALTRAKVYPHDGQLRAVVSHRALGSDGSPAQLFVNGRLASRGTSVAPGSRITFASGRDKVEGTKQVHVTVPADPTGTGLYIGGTPGLIAETVGTVSNEVVHRTVVRNRVLGHLKVPGAIALTFDDGPDPTWTPRVLASLAKYHVQAVFCEIGNEVNAHPDLVRQVVAAGHLLCDHTQNHDEHIASRSQQQMYDEINDCKTAITSASGGTVPRFFRAPGGDWSTQVERVARSDGLTPLKWTVDPRDWSRPGTDAIVDNVMRHVRPGGVILLHDGGGDRSETLAALDRLLVMLPKLGYTFTTPSP